jgi:hypothetical protein
MKKGRESIRHGGTALTLLFLLIMALPAFSRSETKGASVAASPVEAAHYAGSDTCKTCHEDLYTKSFETTAHFKTTLKDGHGCESCHGPGAEHVAGGGDVSKIIRQESLSAAGEHPLPELSRRQPRPIALQSLRACEQ